MNYLISFLACLSLSVMSALCDGANTHWLFISDANVAIFLLLAWCLDGKKKGRLVEISITNKFDG